MKQYWLFILLFLLSLQVFAQNSELGLPFIKSFSEVDYNGESQNFAFEQDDQGLLYMANTIGILEYDGSSWRILKPYNDGVPISFDKDENGRIYCGGTGFIGYLDVDSVGARSFIDLNHLLPKDLKVDFIWNTFHVKGHTFFQNKENILVYNGSEVEVLNAPSIIQNLMVHKGSIYVDTDSGLFLLVDKEYHKLDWSDQFNVANVKFIHSVGGDSLLVGTFAKGLYLKIREQVVPIPKALNDFFLENYAFTSLKLPDGKIAVGTKKAGVIILNPDLSVYYRLTVEGGLSFFDVRGIYLDQHSNLWIATDKGSSKLAYPLRLTYFDNRSGITNSIEEIRRYKSNLLISSFAGSLVLQPSTQEKLLSANPYPEFELILGSGLSNMAVFELGDKLLIGSTTGTRLYDGDKLVQFDNAEARKFFRSILRPELVLQGHRNGINLLIFKNETLIDRISVPDFSAQIRGISEDKEGSIWLGSFTNGVYRLRLDNHYNTISLEHYTEEDGLPSMRDNLVYRVGDEVYFTTHKGIYTFNNSLNRFEADNTFGIQLAEEERFIYAFYEDEEKDIWFNSFRKGATTFAKRIADREYQSETAQFTDMRNMPVYDIYKDNSATWFCGSNGLARYDYWLEPESLIPFNAKIRKVTLSGDSIIYAGHKLVEPIEFIFESYQNDIRFDNAGIYFDEDSQYQYKLEGYDDNWSDWIDETFKIYTNLNHGDYKFMTRARNVKNDISEIDSFRFTIKTPFYFSWWFLTLASFLIIIMLFFIIRYFTTRKLIRRVEELELIQKAQKQRERISRDLHDNVGSNLTYIISSLDYLTFKTDSNKEVSSKADSLSDFTRDTLHQLRDTIWHISSETVTLKKFARRIEEMCLRLAEINEEMEWKILVTGKDDTILQPLPALNIFRVAQEAINNVYKYAQAELLQITISVTQNQLELTIEDNGIGFEVESDGREGHYGLINMKNRMEDIGAIYEITSEIDKGTRISVILNL